MDRLGFVKTFEAILAGLIALSLYSFIQTNDVVNIKTIDRPPVSEINDFIDSININNIINNYDYKRLDYLFNKLFFDTIYYYFEPTYYEQISVNISDESNITFLYHFPRGIDENSIRINNGKYDLPTNAYFNYYVIPIVFKDNINNKVVSINISSTISNVNNKSFRLFINNYETLINVTYWNNSNNNFNATINAYIPSINNNTKTYLLFGVNSVVNNTYHSLANPINVNYFLEPVEKARSAEITFNTGNISSGINYFYVKYSLFTNKPAVNYNLTKNVVNVDCRKRIVIGTTPINANIKGRYGVKRIIPITNGFVELNIYGDYI